jgi:hypothetical protein
MRDPGISIQDGDLGTLTMSLHVLAYNLKRVIKILGTGGLMDALRA